MAGIDPRAAQLSSRHVPGSKTPLAKQMPGKGDLVAFLNSRGGTRTPDPVINSHLLYQLSYSGKHSSLSLWNFARGHAAVKPDSTGRKLS